MTTHYNEEPDWKADPEAIRELAPKGKLRAAINYGNPVLAKRTPEGIPGGVSADLARGLAERLGLDLEFVPFDTAGIVAKVAQDDVWDIAFLAIDPERAESITYSAPYVLIEGTYMVKDDSLIKTIDDVDQKGGTVAVGKGAAYDLFLSRTLKNAEIVRYPLSEDAIERFDRDGVSTVAGVRQPLNTHARQFPGYRVLEGRFTEIKQAMGSPKGRDKAAALVHRYLEFAKANGMVAEGLRRSGEDDALVAPAAQP